MKKSLLAMAVLGMFAGVAQAQSSVTLYGVADVNVQYTSNNLNATKDGTANLVSMQSGGLSGSRWGLRGTEDLGSGNKALFTLESGYNINNGSMASSGVLFNRQAFVGLQNASLGTLTFGRQYTTMFDLLANFSPTGYATDWEPVVLQLGADFRSNNAVKYKGVFGPVTAEGHYAFGAVANPIPGQNNANAGYGAGVAYAAGPFGASVSYDQFNLDSATNKKAAIAGSYTFGPAKLMAGYRWGNAKTANGAPVMRDDYFWAGVNYQATTALGLTLAYSYDKLRNVLGVTSGLSNPWQVQAVADYSLSKRTDLYLTAAYAKHATLGIGALPTSSTGAVLSDNQTGVALGMRHLF